MINGKTYTVSTVQKLETWESGIFEGSNPLLMGLGRGLRYMEYTFPWDDGAERTHNELVAMAREADPEQWRMSKEDIASARQLATAYVAKDGEKVLSLTAADGWRVRKGSAQQPRGYSVPLLIPDSVHAERPDPLIRYASALVDLSVESAESLLKGKAATTVNLVSEFCYFFIQWAQRTPAARLTDAKKRVLIPQLVYSVYDNLIHKSGLTFKDAEEADAFKASWVNSGADRNDFYSRCHLASTPGQGVGGTLFWEAARIIATSAIGKDDPMEHITLSLLLPTQVMRLEVDLLVACASPS